MSSSVIGFHSDEIESLLEKSLNTYGSVRIHHISHLFFILSCSVLSFEQYVLCTVEQIIDSDRGVRFIIFYGPTYVLL